MPYSLTTRRKHRLPAGGRVLYGVSDGKTTEAGEGRLVTRKGKTLLVRDKVVRKRKISKKKV